MKIILLFAMLFISISGFGQENEDYLLLYTEINDSTGFEMYGYKTTNGEIAIKAKYHLAITDTLYKIAFVVDNWSWIAIDRNNTPLLYPFIFDNGPDYIKEGLFRFVENNKIGFANPDGIKIIPAEFDFVEPFIEGIAEYTLGGHKEFSDDEHWIWTDGYETGYINKSGQRFTKVTELINKKREAWTTINNQHVMLNENGEIINVTCPFE